MEEKIGRRALLKVMGAAVGAGVAYRFAPLLARGAGGIEAARRLGQANGERPSSFTFAQFSDTHVGFHGPPAPLGTRAFESAVRLINKSPTRPDFVLFTGDLTHDAKTKDEHARRMEQFKEIAGKIETGALHCVPGENDAALDGGVLYREHFGESHYTFDHKGVHFIALDNVSRGAPEVGAEQLKWLTADLARFPKTAPIIVFTHRPLFDLKPDWEWFTRDGGAVMNVLTPFENVTVLYGHIHRKNVHRTGRAQHYAARSLIFAFNDPATADDKKPLPFDKDEPFKELGIRQVTSAMGGGSPAVDDVELRKSEFSGVAGMQQMTRHSPSSEEDSSDAD